MNFDECQHFIGFAINNLTETEKDVIKLLLNEEYEKKTAMALYNRTKYSKIQRNLCQLP